jgi:hypothetical protein
VLIRTVTTATAQQSLLGVMLSPILFYFSTIFLSESLYHDLSVHAFFFQFKAINFFYHNCFIFIAYALSSIRKTEEIKNNFNRKTSLCEKNKKTVRVKKKTKKTSCKTCQREN